MKKHMENRWTRLLAALLPLAVVLSAGAGAAAGDPLEEVQALWSHNAQLQKDLKTVSEEFRQLDGTAREQTAEAIRAYEESRTRAAQDDTESSLPPLNVYGPPVLKGMQRDVLLVVRDEAGRPVRDIRAEVFDAGREDGWSYSPFDDERGTDENGRRSFRLVPGVYNVLLTAHAGQKLESRAQITVAKDPLAQEFPLLWDQRTPDAYLSSLADRVEFTVVDAQGRPMTGLRAAFYTGNPFLERETDPTCFLDAGGRFVSPIAGRTGRLVLQSGNWDDDTYFYQKTEMTLPAASGVVRQTVVWNPVAKGRIVQEDELPAPPAFAGYDAAALAAEKTRLTEENTRLSGEIEDILARWNQLSEELGALYDRETARIRQRSEPAGGRVLYQIPDDLYAQSTRKPIDLRGETTRTDCVFLALDSAGRPVSNLKMEFVPAFQPPKDAVVYDGPAVTDAAGRLGVRLCPGEYTVRASNPLRAGDVRNYELRVPSGGADDASFSLVWNLDAPDSDAEPRAEIYLRYQDGTPAVGLYVCADYQKNKNRTDYGKKEGSYTDGDGLFILSKPAQRDITLFVREEAGTTRYDVRLPSPTKTSTVKVVLRTRSGPPASNKRPAAAPPEIPSVD